MPSWTDKEKRQYEHIKASNLERGVSEDRAEEIAARTVNKDRREAGKTPSKRTQGTGNPRHSLEDRSKAELQNIAAQHNVKGRSKMKKSELVRAIRSHS